MRFPTIFKLHITINTKFTHFHLQARALKYLKRAVIVNMHNSVYSATFTQLHFSVDQYHQVNIETLPGGTCSLFPPEINCFVPLFPQIKNLVFYVLCSPNLPLFPFPSFLYMCSLVPLKNMPLFPCSLKPQEPYSSNACEI